ncbi:MAG: ATP-binding protein [Candidatus Saccharimonadales bacterium]
MVPFLEPLKQSAWLKVTTLALVSGLLGIGAWVAGRNYLPIDPAFVALAAGGIIVAVSVLVGKVIANQLIAPTDFLARAILLVTHQENQVEAPNDTTLKASKEFLVSLAESIYNLTSASTPSGTDSSEELPFYRSLATTLPLPIIVLDKEQNVRFANELALQYIGQTSETTIGKPVFDVMNLSFVSDMTLESWIQDNASSAVINSEVWERVRLTLPDESRKQFDLVAHYSNDDPNGIETILVLFDRTRQYERDDHDLTFVSLAVHELRTPLTIMRGYIEVFEDELSDHLNPEQTAFMHNMGASAQQLTSFVSNILNVTRVEENALMLHLKEETWKDILLGACKDMELRAHVHNKQLVYEIDADLPTVAVDKVSIYEVIANLIDNAIKYTHTDEKIIVKSYEKDGMVETTITDKGVGISPSLIGHIFEKFYRAHQSKNSVGGTGLGLYLSHAIVTAHGGTIWVQSKEGEGSTFGFTLPKYASVADQISSDDNGEITRGAHGWIKNHSLYRG